MQYRLTARYVMVAMLVVKNNKIFLLRVNFHFYANYVSKFCSVLYTNMAAMQSTYSNCNRTSRKGTPSGPSMVVRLGEVGKRKAS